MNKIDARIQENSARMIDLQAELTAVPALSPENGGEGEWEKAQVLLSWLPRLGIEQVEMLAAPDERVPGGKRPNVLATIPGRSTENSFWIMTHLDVVPPGDLSKWSSDPYTLAVKEDRLVGRGVEDNQQEMVAAIFAAVSILESGRQPARPIKLLFVADEETGSKYGIQYLLEKHRLFAPGDLILVPDGGNREGTELEVAEKNLLWLRIETRGRQCHASMPQDGINAFVAASELVLELADLGRIFPQENPLFQPPVSTFAPTRKEANVPNINTIPGLDVFYLDCRFLPEIDPERVLQEVRRAADRVEKKRGVKVEISTVQQVASPPTPADTPLVGLLKEAIRDVYGVEGRVVGIGGGTVGAYLRRAGQDTVIWSRIEETAHMPDESCLIANMIGDCRVMARIMMADRR